MATRGHLSDHKTSRTIPVEGVATGCEQGSLDRCEVSSFPASAAVLWPLGPNPNATSSRKPFLLLLSSELPSIHLFRVPNPSPSYFVLCFLEDRDGLTRSRTPSAGLNPGWSTPSLTPLFMHPLL